MAEDKLLAFVRLALAKLDRRTNWGRRMIAEELFLQTFEEMEMPVPADLLGLMSGRRSA